MSSAWLVRIKALRDEALEALARRVGDDSLCGIGWRHAGGGPAEVKRLEGRAAAFSEARRMLAVVPAERMASALAELIARWERLGEARRGEAAWEAYSIGGVQALRALQDEVRSQGTTR